MGAKVWGVYKFNGQEEDLLHSEIDYRKSEGYWGQLTLSVEYITTLCNL